MVDLSIVFCMFTRPGNTSAKSGHFSGVALASSGPVAQEQSSRFNGALANPGNVQTAQDLSKKARNAQLWLEKEYPLVI